MIKIKSRIQKIFMLLLGMAVLMGTMPVCRMVSATGEEDAAAAGSGGKQMAVMRSLTADEIVAEMGTGWNLGNTMDGHTGFTPGETTWQSVVTTKALMKSIHDLGFNTVRVPVTWGTMIDDDNDYAIDEAWISRVQDIVDYGVSLDMYVIINVHHDGAEQTGWLRVANGNKNIDKVCEKFEAVWKQIAERFISYDEHLIFESMNEVKGGSDNEDDIEGDVANINALNQLFVDTVRATGGNNAFRWLSVPGRYTNIDITTNEAYGFAIPNDSVENKIFVAVHDYDWLFGLKEDMEVTEYSDSDAGILQARFEKLNDVFTSKGIPVILGEYGAANKDNTAEREFYYEKINKICAQYGVVPVAWDQGWYDRSEKPDYSFALVDRENGEPVDKEVTDAIMRGFFYQNVSSSDLFSVEKGMEVVPFTKIDLAEDTAVLTVGDMYEVLEYGGDAEGKGDVILWKSENESVATVYNGRIRARGIGMTTVTAFSQAGDARAEMTVVVQADKENTACSEISDNSTDGKVVVAAGEYVYLDAAVKTEGSNPYLTCQSSDESVATVSTTGKVLGIAEGNAFIIVTAATGMTKVIPVTVTAAEQNEEIKLALNVYYNDGQTEYYSNECGKSIKVDKEGTYRVAFDCKKDLSDDARDVGVHSLKNLTAVYIKDYDVTKGKTTISPLASCDIFYEKIVVDGKKLTITQQEPKSALKDPGIFDTNDPINSWDGSVVEEVRANSDHVLNFTEIKKAKKVEVTFTLSNMQFVSSDAVKQAGEVTELAVSGNKSIMVGEDGETAEIAATVKGSGDTAVCFVSADAAVAAVNPAAVMSEDGSVAATVVGLSSGTVAVTAYTPNGLTAVYQVNVKQTDVEPEETAAATKQPEEKEDTRETEEKGIQNAALVTGVCVVIIIVAVGALIVFLRKKH